MELAYGLADADGHYYEPDDCFSRHIGPSYRDQAIHVVRASPDDIGRVLLGDELLQVFPTHLSDATFEPGAVRGAVYGDERVSPRGRDRIRASDVPPGIDPTARLAAMDSLGLETNVLYSTLGLTVWPELLARGPDVAYANLRSFNLWLEEAWGYATAGRILTAPMLLLVDTDAAIAELERVLAAGARVIHLVPTGPRIGALPGDERFLAFWEAVEDAGVAVGIHGCVVSYGDLYSPPGTTTSLREQTAMQHLLEVDRQIMDTLASLVLGDVFGRCPGIRVMSIELGSRWVEYLLGAVDRASFQSAVPWQAKPRDARPSEVLREHLWVQPFETDDVARLAEVLGVDHLLFGSDFPHPEGLENPLQFLDAVQGFTPDDQRLILRENLLGLLPA